jgi:transcriptional regulator with XRE-family HTH domain
MARNRDQIRTLASERIEDLMRQCRLTQEELAEALHVHPSTISRHISDQTYPRVKQLRAYEAFFSAKLNKRISIP